MKRTYDARADTFGPMVYPVRVQVGLSTLNTFFYTSSFFDGEIPQEPKGKVPPVVSQVTTKPIPTTALKPHIELQPILSKSTSVVSQKISIVRKRKLRVSSSSDSDNDNLTLAERNQKKHLKVAGALTIPKSTSYVVSKNTTDSEKGT